MIGNGPMKEPYAAKPRKEPNNEKPEDEKASSDAVGRQLEAAPVQTSRTDIRLLTDAQMFGVTSTFQPVSRLASRAPSPCCYSPEAELWRVDSPTDPTQKSQSRSPSPETLRRRREEETQDDSSRDRTTSPDTRTPPQRDSMNVSSALRDQHLSENLRASLLMTAKHHKPESSSTLQDAVTPSYQDSQDQPYELALEPTTPRAAAAKNSFSAIDQTTTAPAPVTMFFGAGNPSRSAFTEKTRHGETVYQRMVMQGEELSEVPKGDLRKAAEQLVDALRLRHEYMERIGSPSFPITTTNFLSEKYPKELPVVFIKPEKLSDIDFHPPPVEVDHWGLDQPLPKYKPYTLNRRNGVVEIIDPSTGEVAKEIAPCYMSKEKFLSDTERISQMMVDGPLKSYCYRRLSLLQNKFQLHVLMNELRELNEQKVTSHKDFYNIRKVDTHIHAASSMNQKHLVRFIKKKLKKDGDAVVLQRNGVPMTLKDVFRQMGIKAEDLSVDMLDVHADRNTFHRFDKFNTKYNPIGDSSLRETFLKTDNFVEGKYFAELLKEVFSDLEDSKYQHAELRLSIYGRKADEWDKLAKWAISKDVWSTNVKWMVQIPRLYDIYRAKDMVKSFDDMLNFIFTPLFEATNDPASHPDLHHFLAHVSGIDCVDDESKHEFVHFDRSTPAPPDYRDQENPPYRYDGLLLQLRLFSYYIYYLYANICALNAFRRLRGLNTFALRPHCGEAGHVNHLLAGYLTSESISHGILLRKVPVLQYLFYLTQMGIAMSPLSNNSLFISYQRNPLPEYLQKGLNVSLSTDDPLQFHYTREALMEEYSIAAQVWKLSSCDMCELARNSVLQSGFEDKLKRYWLGGFFREEGVMGNDIRCTNVPDIRVSFRHEALIQELKNLFRAVSTGPSSS